MKNIIIFILFLIVIQPVSATWLVTNSERLILKIEQRITAKRNADVPRYNATKWGHTTHQNGNLFAIEIPTRDGKHGIPLKFLKTGLRRLDNEYFQIQIMEELPDGWYPPDPDDEQ